MSAWIVYSKDGLTERCELHAVEYGGTHMGERAVTATFESDSKVDFDIFDYLSYRGEVFELESVPTVKKTSSFEYSYELRFVSRKYELERCEMRDLVPSDNGMVYPTPLSFSFTGDVRYLTDRIQACLDDLYGEGVWNIVIADGVESEEKNITIAQQNCWNALALVNSTYGLDFYIKGRVITIGGSQPVVSHVFEYGKGNGLYEIERAANTDTAIVTKLRAYGSDRNLDYSYPKKPEWSDSNLPVSFAFSPLRLMLPSFKVDKTDYVLADEETIKKYGIREASIVYEDIYPSITGATHNGQAIDEIKAVEAVDDNASTFVVHLHDLGFDLEEHLTTADAQISMKSGAMQGYTFTISNIEKQEDNSYKIALGRVSAEGGENYNIPNSDWNMREGDKFVLLNILMPQKYIREAENRLKQRAEEYLAQYSKTNFGYNIGLHDKFLIENPSVYDALIEGSKLSVYDEELGISEDVTIQSITITENAADNILPQVKVTLNNEPSASTLDRIQGKIDSLANESAANNFATQSEIMAQYRKKLDKPFFDKLFAAVDAEGNEIPSTDTVTPVAYIKARYDFAVVGGVTMYLNDGPLDLPNIFEGLPIDNNTIYWDGDVLKSRGVGEGDVTPTLLGDLTNVGAWANAIATEDRIMVQKKDSPSWEALELSKIGGSADFSNVKEIGVGNAHTSFTLSEDKKTLTFVKGQTFALKSELDSKWTKDETKINNWNKAYGWGDHAAAGYAAKATTLAGYGITNAYTKEEINGLLDEKADWGTTLADYGITNAYTKTEVKTLLKDYLPLTGGTITGDLRLRRGTENTSPYLYFGDGEEVWIREDYDGYLTLHAKKQVSIEATSTSIDGIEIKKTSDGVLYIGADLIVKGGVTMYADESGHNPSTITDAVIVDNKTILKDKETGALMINPELTFGEGGGGELNSVAWGSIFGIPSWITTTKPIYNYTEIEGTPDLSVYAVKGNTLAHYGITDTYTSKQIDTLVGGYLPLSGGEMTGGIILQVDTSAVNPSLRWGEKGRITVPSNGKFNILTEADFRVYTGVTDINNAKLRFAISPNGDIGTTGTLLVGKGGYLTNSDYKFYVYDGMSFFGEAVTVAGSISPYLSSFYSIGSEANRFSNVYTDKVDVGGISIEKTDDGVIFINGNVVVRGGITMYGTNENTAPLIWDDAPIANTQGKKGVASYDPNYFSVNNGVVTFVGQTGGGGVADSVSWKNVKDKPAWIGDTKPAYTTSEVTEGTNLYFTNARAVSALSSTLSNYLPLSGGTINGVLTIKPTNIAGVQDGIVLHDGDYGSGESLKIKWTSESYKTGLSLLVQQNNESLLFENSDGFNTVWHSGNDGKLRKNVLKFAYSKYTNGSYRDADFLDGGILINYNTTSEWKNTPADMSYGAILDISYDLSRDLTGQLAWDVNQRVWFRTKKYSGWTSWREFVFADSGMLNAETANKLKTARTLWGKSFDGSADIKNADITLYQNESSYTGGWARAILSRNSSGDILGEIGFYGYGESLGYTYLGGRYSSPRMVILADGKVGVGTTNPQYDFDVNGSTRIQGSSVVRSVRPELNNSYGLGDSSYLWANLYTKKANIDGIEIKKSADGVLYIGGNLVVSGGVTMYGTDGNTASTLWDNAPIASTSVKGIASFDSNFFAVNNGKVTFIGQTGGGTSVDLSGYYTKTQVDSLLEDNYLSLSGGRMTGDLYLQPEDSLGSDKSYGSRIVFGDYYVKAPYIFPYAYIGEDEEDTLTVHADKGVQLTTDSSHTVTVNGKEVITTGNMPTELPNPSILEWSGYSSGTYDGSTKASIDIPSNTNQLTNGAGFITSSGSITGNAATATTATNLASAPSLSAFGDTEIKVTAGNKTSDAFTVPYATTASKLSTTQKTAWGQKYWTSEGVPTSIDGDMENVGHITLKSGGTYDIGTSLVGVRDIYTQWIGGVSGDKLSLGANNGTAITILTDQSVGIGTAKPESKLHAAGTIQADSAFLLTSKDTGNATLGYYQGGSMVLRHNSSGQTILSGSGGTLYFRPNGTSSNSGQCTISTGGDVLVTGGVTMYSDLRKKTILNHVELSLKEVADAPLIEHYYNSDESKRTHVGSVAQYWAGLNDWFCKEDGEGFLTMEIQNAALASAISVARELTRYESKTDKQIKKLKKRIGELEEEIENLKKV